MEIQDVLAKLDDRLARQDEILAQLAALLGRMDDRLMKQDETLRQIDVHMARLGEFMASGHHEAAAAHQTTNVVMTRPAEQAMALDTTLQAFNREHAPWPYSPSWTRSVSPASHVPNSIATSRRAASQPDT